MLPLCSNVFSSSKRNSTGSSAALVRLARVLRDALVAQVRSLIERELETDRIDRNHGRKQRLPACSGAGHEIARRHAAVADAAGNRRAQLGEFEIEFVGLYRGFRRLQRGIRRALGLHALVIKRLRDGLLRDQRLRAREIGIREIGLRLRAGEIGTRLIECGLERALVEREEQVTRLHELAVGEVHLVEIAGYARADFDRIDRHEAANIFVAVDDLALDRGCNRHLRRGRRRWRALSAGGEQKSQRNCGTEGRCRAMHGLSRQ